MPEDGSSRIPGFYKLPIEERRAEVSARAALSPEEFSALDDGGLDLETADGIVENVVGTYALPFGVALNFRINGRDRLVPMVVEEPSVIAAASNAARLIRRGGGFTAESDPPVMIGQVQLVGVADPARAVERVLRAKERLLAMARECTTRLVVRGGGPVGLSARILSEPGDPDGGMVVVHLEIDCRDAMGANLVNSTCEWVAPAIAEAAGHGASVGLRILTNLCDRRCVRVTARLPLEALDDGDGVSARKILDGVVMASRFAELDAYRAATHNKGIMNGVDAVLVATGNDWRSVEAGAHAFAARQGRYAPLSVWKSEADGLVGTMEIPMAVGLVGGPQRVHRAVRLAHRILGVTTGSELGEIAASAGLACNLAALRALATVGIQEGHMSLHARVVARAAGARGARLERVAAELSRRKEFRPEVALEILERIESEEEPPSALLARG